MATVSKVFFNALCLLLLSLSHLWGQCTLSAPSYRPPVPGITWTDWTIPPTGCPSATAGVVQITGTTSSSKQSLNANNTTYFAVGGSVEYADFNMSSNSDKMNIVVCQGAILYLGVATQNSTHVNIVVMPGGTLIPNTSTSALWKGKNYVYGNLISPNRDLSLTGNGGDSTVIYVAPSGIFQVTGTTPGSPDHNSILSFPSSGGIAGIYNEGAVDVNDLIINSSSQPLICSNSTNSCIHIRSSFPTTNTNDQFATGTAGGFLKYDATSGTVTYNKRVATTALPATPSTLKVCTSGANYCLAGGCCILTPSCSTQVAGGGNGSPFGNIIPNSDCGSIPVSCSLPLSVHLAYFNAKKSAEGVKIKWATSTQENSKLFIVEKSHNGIEWIEVGQIPSSGTNYDYKEYQLSDYSPWSGDSYYRLVEVENNNSEKIYAVDLVQISLEGTSFLISPNPSNGNVTISLGDNFERYDIEVIDIKGSQLGTYTFFPGKNALTIPKPGMYLAKLKVGHSVVVQKFIVQ